MSAPSTEGEAPEWREPLYLRYADPLWPVTNRLAGVHAHLYKRTGGRFGGRLPGGRGRMLLLDHVGAKSGALRTSPLLFIPDGENLVIVASKGGFPKNPAWFHNLRANPVTYAQVGPERRRVRARVATATERPRLWELAVDVWPGYEDYRARADREIPLVVLEPDAA
ncbi:MAG: nitroreductase family deazaflavin-dependent oxidoreductase [Actinobacteria bacterium]|nr:nitroreductase family deazaflavin-dependent oxidoreductase [Actinomycetota bacterium]